MTTLGEVEGFTAQAHSIRRESQLTRYSGRFFLQKMAHAAHEELEMHNETGIVRPVFGDRYAKLALNDLHHHPLDALDDLDGIDGRPAPSELLMMRKAMEAASEGSGVTPSFCSMMPKACWPTKHSAG